MIFLYETSNYIKMPPFFFDQDAYKILERGDKIYTEFLISPKTNNLVKIIEEYVSTQDKDVKKQWEIFTTKEFDLVRDWKKFRREANLCMPWVVSLYRREDGSICVQGHKGFDVSLENFERLNRLNKEHGLPTYQFVGRQNDDRMKEWMDLQKE
jgi:hypothetical protein